MKKGEIFEGRVLRMDFPNKGIVCTEAGGTVIVKNALPGQRVQFRINKLRKGKAEGQLLQVLEKAPQEDGPTCSFFGVCGGCTSLSMNYDSQLRMKEEQIRRLLEPVLERQSTAYTWEGILGSPKPYEYRNKMEFSFGDEYKDGPLALGLHRRGSFYDLVTVRDCRIVDADYRSILTATCDFFAERGVTYFHKNTHFGYLRHLLVRKAAQTGEILVALVTSSQTDAMYGSLSGCPEESGAEMREMSGCGEDRTGASEKKLLEDYTVLLKSLPLQGTYAGILHIVNDSIADVVRGDRTDLLYGKDWFYEELLGLRFRISTFSFFQTNSYSAEVLYGVAREYVKDALRGEEEKPAKLPEVFDLYSGTGTIAQLIAPVAAHVTGVEIVEEAVEAAKRNAEENGLTNCSFLAGDVLKVLDDIPVKPDLIILDPPRDGIHPKALPKILSYGVEHIVYISCKPTSLARDLESFLDAGYVVKRVCCVDQFPWTANTETAVLLCRQNVDG